jgi:hypothetical protein
MTPWQGEIPEQCELSNMLPQFRSCRSKSNDARRLLRILDDAILTATEHEWVKKTAAAVSRTGR